MHIAATGATTCRPNLPSCLLLMLCAASSTGRPALSAVIVRPYLGLEGDMRLKPHVRLPARAPPVSKLPQSYLPHAQCRWPYRADRPIQRTDKGPGCCGCAAAGTILRKIFGRAIIRQIHIQLGLRAKWVCSRRPRRTHLLLTTSLDVIQTRVRKQVGIRLHLRNNHRSDNRRGVGGER